MQRIKPEVDVIRDLLEAVLTVQPASSFTQSLLHQYNERGGLSKKQLQGLFQKATRIPAIPPGKLATLEAIILKKPTRFKSVIPRSVAEEPRDNAPALVFETILALYPNHKRVLFLKSRYEHGGLTPTEAAELARFEKLVRK